MAPTETAALSAGRVVQTAEVAWERAQSFWRCRLSCGCIVKVERTVAITRPYRVVCRTHP